MRRRLITTNAANTNTLATLRRFLMLVHPDLIQKECPEEKRVNTTNVALLQAYIREHQYQGSAWLLFHKKERAGTARVVVGRGVDACVASMAVALGEIPATGTPQTTSRPERVVEWAGRWRGKASRRPSPAQSPQPTLATFVAAEDVVPRRRAMAHAAAKARRAVGKHRLRRFESRCGWSARHLVQVVTGLEKILEGDFENLWSVVLSSSTEARADAVEGLILLSPSMQVTDWRRALDDAVKLMDVRRAHAQRQSEALFDAERNIERALARPVELRRGESLDAVRFEEWCRCVPRVAAVSRVEKSRPTLRIRVELDTHRGGSFDETSGSLAVGFREKDKLDNFFRSTNLVSDSTVQDFFNKRAEASRLAAACVEKFNLASLDLVLAQVPEAVRVTRHGTTHEDSFVLSGAHKQRGASLSSVLTALSNLRRHDDIPHLFRNMPVAIVGEKASLGHDHAGVLVVPVDALA